MQIKTVDGMESVSSAGVGGTALGLGIGALSLALLQGGNNCNGGILGNLFGNGKYGCNNNEEHNDRVISALQSNIARLESEKYTDSVGIELYKEIVAKSNSEDVKINANYKELAQFIASLDKQIAVERQKTQDNFAFLDNRINEEAKSIKCYVDANFVPGKLVMPLDSICPEAMKRYNSWTAPTNLTTQTTPAP